MQNNGEPKEKLEGLGEYEAIPKTTEHKSWQDIVKSSEWQSFSLINTTWASILKEINVLESQVRTREKSKKTEVLFMKRVLMPEQ